MMGFARVCSECKGRCDPGEMIGGICFDCRMKLENKEKVRQEADRIVRTDVFEQLELEWRN